MRRNQGIAATFFFVGFGAVGAALFLPTRFGLPPVVVLGVQWGVAVASLFVAVIALYRHLSEDSRSRETGRLAGQGRQPRTVRVRGRRSR